MPIILGMDCKLYLGTAGTKATTEMQDVKNVTLNLDKGEADVTTRGNNGWRTYVGTLKEASLEFDLLYNSESTSEYKTLLNAYLDGGKVSMFVGESATDGLDADWVITGFNKTQDLEDASAVSVTARIAPGRNPQWLGAS
jgi:hypothetical protein